MTDTLVAQLEILEAALLGTFFLSAADVSALRQAPLAVPVCRRQPAHELAAS